MRSFNHLDIGSGIITTEEVEPKWISGVWRRIGALFMDALILGIAGSGLGLFLEGAFAELGACFQ